MKNRLKIIFGLVISMLLGVSAFADVTLTGVQADDVDLDLAQDTIIHLNGVTFTDTNLKLSGDCTYTLYLEKGTTNTFQTIDDSKKFLIKAAASSNLKIAGTGTLVLLTEKRVKDDGAMLVCNDLTIESGEVKFTYDNDKTNKVGCALVKGNYLQTGGKVKVNLKSKNTENEFYGIKLDTKNTTFTLSGGSFEADLGGTGSSAIHLKASCSATFSNCKVETQFEGPNASFIYGGSIVFESGDYFFTTNITEKMQSAYYPTGARAIKADTSITVNDGDFEADLPLASSEIFETDSETGTFININGGTFDLIAGNDCMNSHTDINITGGRFRGYSVFDDVLDANGNLYISGGTVRAFATQAGTHGIDVNVAKSLQIAGGNVVALDGPSADAISVSGTQVRYYNFISTTDFSQKYVVIPGETNGVSTITKVCLPELTPSKQCRLLVSVPGLASTWKPTALSVADAYNDVSSHNPIVFERKAVIQDHTITTREGAVLQIPTYYDLNPTEGKTKTITLTLNDNAKPAYADETEDGVPAIELTGEVVYVGVKTLSGLSYQLLETATLGTTIKWEDVGSPCSGDGEVHQLSTTKKDGTRFYCVRVED